MPLAPAFPGRLATALDQRAAGYALQPFLVMEHELQIAMGKPRMLAHQAFRPRALPRLDGFDYALMVLLRETEHGARLRQAGLRHHEGARRGEGQRDDPVDLPR